MRAILFLLLAIASSNAIAERQVGIVSGVIVSEENDKKLFFFKLKNNLVSGCNTTGRYAFDESKDNYYLMSSAILTAFKMKEEVTVEYTPTCNAWPNSFDIRYVCMGDINC